MTCIIMCANERRHCTSSEDTHGKHIHDNIDEDINLYYKVEDASLYTRWSHRILVA